jgi:hypothetical protein
MNEGRRIRVQPIIALGVLDFAVDRNRLQFIAVHGSQSGCGESVTPACTLHGAIVNQ